MRTKQKLISFLKWSIILNLILCSIVIRLWDINAVGRTWDEYSYVSTSSHLVDLVRRADFTDRSWYEIVDHPPVARYFYGLASYYDRINIDTRQNQWDFKYAWTFTRGVSVIFTSITVIFVILLGWEEFSPFVGIVAGIIFITL